MQSLNQEIKWRQLKKKQLYSLGKEFRRDMTTHNPLNNNITARVIPGLKSEYRIVTLPHWAWFWLDDFMIQNRICYQGILDSFKCDGNINNTLRNIAEMHQDHCMRSRHNLVNDNSFSDTTNAKIFTRTKKIKNNSTKNRMPKVYKLFGFMPCTTTLDAIWCRLNYTQSNFIP